MIFHKDFSKDDRVYNGKSDDDALKDVLIGREIENVIWNDPDDRIKKDILPGRINRNN